MGRIIAVGRRLSSGGVGAMLVRLLAVVAVLETALLLYPVVRARVLSLEEAPPVRGRRLAATLGCFGCHGPDGTGGTKNPGSEEQSVPAFTGQTQMMYVKTTDDLREYVLDGAPARKRNDPDYQKKMEGAALRMPAYRGYVRPDQVEDLVAYLRAASGQIIPEDELTAHGAEVANDLGCFACHGALGGGGVPNPGSFKGYVPGFWGADFDDLVHDDDELRRWIAEGEIKRISEHPVGRWFFEHQRLSMAPYGHFISPDDVHALVVYVRWIRAHATELVH